MRLTKVGEPRLLRGLENVEAKKKAGLGEYAGKIYAHLICRSNPQKFRDAFRLTKLARTRTTTG